MTTKSDEFGRLARGAINAIANFEGKNAGTIQEELGDLIGMDATAFHRFKQGFVPRPHIVEILAEHAVRRAYLNRIWLERFLDAAHYPNTPRLVARLCPTAPEPIVVPGIYTNLPAPTYSQFVMRPDAVNDVIEGLCQRSPLVLIVSLGGMGKTSLAQEVATQCIHQQPATDHPHFDAVVWVSDKDHPGTTDLSVVLDEIARTLDHPGFTQFSLRDKKVAVEQLLRQMRVLLVVDNFETIRDDTLLHWLLRLPEPSKAIITTREYRHEFQRGAWLVELDGMHETEAQQFIDQWSRQLKIRHIGDDVVRQRMIGVTGGNPKAIEMALGYCKLTGQSLEQAIEGLRMDQHDLFTDLFEHSWEILSTDARRIVLALTLFPTSTGHEALACAAGVPQRAFNEAVQQLVELAILESEQHEMSATARWMLHPLTRTFAETKLKDQMEFEQSARERWLLWAIECAAGVGFAFDDMARLTLLDVEIDNLTAALTWAFYDSRYREAIQIIKGIEFYYYVRALWGKKLALHRLYIDAARKLGDVEEEITALSLHIQLLSRQGNMVEAEQYLPRLRSLEQTHELHGTIFFNLYHTIGLYALTNGNAHTAQQAWKHVLNNAAAERLPDHMVIGAQQWLATALYRQGHDTEAQHLYQQVLDSAQAHGFDRIVARNQLHLAQIDLDQNRVEQATQRLTESQTRTRSDDREQHARIQWAYGRLYALQNDNGAAETAYVEAMDLFKRMGLQREIDAAWREFIALQDAGE